MAGHVDCQVDHCPTSFLFSIWQGPSVASHPGGTIICQWFLPSYFPFLKNIYFMLGWSTVLCHIDQCQCFQIHVYIWIIYGRLFLWSWSSSSIHYDYCCLLLVKKLVALGVLMENIHFFIPSGDTELMHFRNSNWSLIPWTPNNTKGVGPSWRCSKTSCWSK